MLVKRHEKFEVVQDCRLPNGGGMVRRGAMLLHRRNSNSAFTIIVCLMFGAQRAKRRTGSAIVTTGKLEFRH